MSWSGAGCPYLRNPSLLNLCLVNQGLVNQRRGNRIKRNFNNQALAKPTGELSK
jgi:hypothetical protein